MRRPQNQPPTRTRVGDTNSSRPHTRKSPHTHPARAGYPRGPELAGIFAIPRWTGSFKIHKVFPYGAVELENPKDGSTFKVNGHRLKPFLEKPDDSEENIELGEPNYNAEE